MIVIGASLMVSHWVPLPRPELDPTSSQTFLARFQSTKADGQWLAIHFLYAECPCSRRVLDRVTQRSPQAEVAERIVLIGDAPQLAAKAKERGFEIDCVAPQELLAKYGVEAAPLLMILDPDGHPRYSGGYTSRKQLLDIQDRAILKQLRSGQEVEPLPLFGCAVSGRLKSLVDSLGLKSN
jgi:hypothetical protein